MSQMQKRRPLQALLLVLAGLPLLGGAASALWRPASGTGAPDEVVEAVLRIGREDSRVHEPLEYLVEHIGSRLTGSSDLQRACEWAVARFAALGLDARIERWGEVPVGFERGAATGGLAAPVKVDWVFGTPAWSPGTPGPVRARAVLGPQGTAELAADPERWRGAWVVSLPRDERPTRRERREVGEQLAALGIAGKIQGTGTLVHTGGNHRVDWDELPATVSINVQDQYFADLTARLERGEEVELEFDIDNRFTPGPVPQYNVVADLLGSEFPDEYVVVGGHLDSWDGAPCAQDNATGCSTTLEAARLLVAAGAKPRRTIRFTLWTGEEQGLLGSRAYVEQNAELMERISAVLVHDGGTNFLSGIAGPAALVDDLRTALGPIMDHDPDMPFEIVQNSGLSTRGASDHSSYTAAGVPGFFWRQSGRADYDFVHHTQHDTLDHVVPEYQRHSALVVAVGAYGLAQLDHLLSREGLIDPSGGGRRRDPTRRTMGVYLDGVALMGVTGDGMAAAAGWKEDDVILSVDGVEVASQAELVAELQKGGPKKAFRLRRGEEVIESVLDYTDSPSEKARAAKAAKEAAEALAESQAAEAEAEPAEASAVGAGSGG